MSTKSQIRTNRRKNHKRPMKKSAQGGLENLKKSRIYRHVSFKTLRQGTKMIPLQDAKTYTYSQLIQADTLVSGGAVVQFRANSLFHQFRSGAVVKVIAGLTNDQLRYSSARILAMEARLRAIPLDTNPATIRMGFSNDNSLGSTFSNYFQAEGNPYYIKMDVATIGTPIVGMRMFCDFQDMVGGQLVVTDDAYITNKTTDPLDTIGFNVECDNPLGTTFNLGKYPLMDIQFKIWVYWFGWITQDE